MSYDPTVDHTVQVQTIIEGLLLVLSGISILAVIFFIYASYLLKNERRDRNPEWRLFATSTWAVCLVVLVVLTLCLTYLANRFDYRLGAPMLVAGWITCALIYFQQIRTNWYDDRIQYSALLWSAFWFLTMLLILFLWWLDHIGGSTGQLPLKQDVLSQYVNAFAQLVGIIIAATMVIITIRSNAKQSDETARQGIYQTLERESIKLFRFEIEHRDLVQALWYDEPTQNPPHSIQDKLKAYRIKQYTCQILNLFEMACRFRKAGIMEPDIFGSWIIWVWELCSSNAFKQEWQGRSYEERIEFNYIEIFRNLMNAGIYYASAPVEDLILSPHIALRDYTSDQRMRSFARYAAHEFIDPVTEGEPAAFVMRWLGKKAASAGPIQIDIRKRYAKFSDPEYEPE